MGLIGVLYAGIILGMPSLVMKLEIYCVNAIGLPFTSGIAFLAALVGGSLAYALWQTAVSQKPLLHHIFLGFVFILLGYSSYLLVPIRASANPPINEGDPSNIIRFYQLP